MIEDGKEVSITSIKKEFNINEKLEKVIVGYKDETLGDKYYKEFIV